MTQDEIIEMARQAGIEFNEERIPVTGFKYQGAMIVYEELEAFAKLVAAKEREACAKVCDAEFEKHRYSSDAIDCAIAIRARGEA